WGVRHPVAPFNQVRERGWKPHLQNGPPGGRAKGLATQFLNLLKTRFHSMENCPKHVSIVWKIAQTCFHSMETCCDEADGI
ncbi:MAG: hypothetical protein ILO10_02495, partial [Kiritimatiellae bacterium]|nr:hypothetical protein [Kiritimatiellia bacterium]